MVEIPPCFKGIFHQERPGADSRNARPFSRDGSDDPDPGIFFLQMLPGAQPLELRHGRVPDQIEDGGKRLV